MRLFLIILILIFSLQLFTKADDIREFEIEGISIGDSLYDHFKKEQLNNALEIYNYPGSNKFIYYFLRKKNYEVYEYIHVHVSPSDKNFIIESIEGHIEPKSISECNNKMQIVKKELEKILNINSQEDTGSHPTDPTGKSTYIRNMFYFSNGDYAEVICYDMSNDYENQGKTDRFVVSLSSKKLLEFLTYEAYK